MTAWLDSRARWPLPSDLDPHLEDRHRDLAVRLSAFGEAHLRAVARDEEDPSGRAREIGARLGEAGLLAAAVPAPFGSMDVRSVLVARERLAYFSLLAETVFAIQGLAAHVLATAGTEVQRSRWLPALAAGSVLGAIAFTEPEAGSDLGAVRTTARPEGSLWRLTGVKTWVTAAGGAGLYVILARSSEGDGYQGLSLFLADGGAPGVKVRPLDAMATLPVGDIQLDDTPAVLLGHEGRGARLVTKALVTFRPGAAGAACGLAARALEEAVRHALTRRQFGRPLAGFQATRMALANMHAELEAARGLARHAAWLADVRSEEAPRAAAAARLVAAETAGRIADGAVQIHGAQGLVRGSTVERVFREARALRVREGTSELLRLELAEAILKESR